MCKKHNSMLCKGERKGCVCHSTLGQSTSPYTESVTYINNCYLGYILASGNMCVRIDNMSKKIYLSDLLQPLFGDRLRCCLHSSRPGDILVLQFPSPSHTIESSMYLLLPLLMLSILCEPLLPGKGSLDASPKSCLDLCTSFVSKPDHFEPLLPASSEESHSRPASL